MTVRVFRERKTRWTIESSSEGWLYLAVVLDLGSRRLLGYAMSDRIDTRLVADAFDMAANARGGRTAGIIFHSDRGSRRRQYLSGNAGGPAYRGHPVAVS